MTRILVLVTALALSAASAIAQAPATAARPTTALITITVPNEDTELTVDGKPLPGNGSSRQFTPPAAGGERRYTFAAKWNPNSYTTMTRTRTVSVRPGERVTVDLTTSDPSDRVRVVYVPTPQDVAEAMVRLAGVTKDDVVFEPGCGDARITMTAVRAGAKRGVGIDIDPERVTASRDGVKAAGLEDRIEIRLGDALDIKDLSSATVVLLYMGDHFNLLLRPQLWKDLRVGSRIVSHRFKMGDWEPDKTITVTSDEGGEYELHLWTITEEIKRKAR